MKKFWLFAGFATLFVGATGFAHAQQQPMVRTIGQQQAGVVQYFPQNTQYIPANTVAQMPASANPSRVTGALPRVGNNQNAVAMRQYYQPNSFDRLSDSGLYIGLSIAYSSSIQGGMTADYQNEQNSWYVPGSFSQSNFKHDTVLPLQLSVGAAINNDVRVDFSYTRYSGLGYPDIAQSSDGLGGLIDTRVTGGAVSSSATMLNLYYNLDSFTGNLAGGSMRPYVGLGVGIATNTISDYLIYDNRFYPEVEIGVPSPAGQLTAISDIYAYHAGGTTEQLAYMLEGGITTSLEGGIKLDFFVRWAQMGKVQSSGSIVVSQTEWLGTGYGNIGDDGAEEPAPYDSVFHYTNWFESGKLGMVDVGVRMRLQF
ncbi:hypothetical protein FACS189421_08500 [Bacteroidia bacterium]|nr:hypothetical protein FACS189421_08500 [Bacteroidia bacterium]